MLSIIIPTKNRKFDLINAINSIVVQMSESDELIIIDQSTNNLRNEVLKNLPNDRYSHLIKYFHCSESVRSLPEARQRGVEKATKDYIFFLEDDIELCEDTINSVKLIFSNDENLAGGCGIDANTKPSHIYKLLFTISHLGLYFDRRVLADLYPHNHSGLPSKFLSGGISFYRAKVFEKVQFDLRNDFFALEDMDFSYRVNRKFGPTSTKVFSHIRILHHQSPLNRAQDYQRWSRKIREYLTFHKKFKRNIWDDLAIYWLLTCLGALSIANSCMSLNPAIIKGFLSGLFKGIGRREV